MAEKKKLKSSHPGVRDVAKGSHTVRVRLVGGLRGVCGQHRLSVKALGLNRTNDVRELKDSPQVRGLINKVNYLVRVEE